MSTTYYASRRGGTDPGYEDQPEGWTSWVIEDAFGMWVADLPGVETGGANEVAEAASTALGQPVDASLPTDPDLRDMWVLSPSRLVMQRVRDSRIELEAAAEAVAEAVETQRAAVRSALESGISAVAVAEALGVTRARVYQIRDGRR